MSSQRPSSLDTQPVHRIESPTYNEFERSFAAPRLPVLITGAMRTWRALAAWSFTSIREQHGRDVVVVYRSRDRFFPGGVATGYDGRRPEDDGRSFEKMTLGQFLDLVKVGSAAEGHHYLYQFPLARLGSMVEDITLPEYVRDPIACTANLWVSAVGHVTPAHFDYDDNFLCQVVGKKEVLLFAPEEYPNLYLNSCDHVYERQSQVLDLESANLDSFPRLRHAKTFRAELMPGEMIYIPSFWFHQVTTESDSISVSLPCPDLDRYGALLAKWKALLESARSALPVDVPASM